MTPPVPMMDKLILSLCSTRTYQHRGSQDTEKLSESLRFLPFFREVSG